MQKIRFFVYWCSCKSSEWVLLQIGWS